MLASLQFVPEPGESYATGDILYVFGQKYRVASKQNGKYRIELHEARNTIQKQGAKRPGSVKKDLVREDQSGGVKGHT